MGKKVFYVLIAFLLILNISTLITILQGSGGVVPGESGSAVVAVIAEQLGIDEAQAAEITSIRESFESEVIVSEQLLVEKQNELLQFISADNPEMGRIDAVIDEIGRIRTQLQKEAVTRIIQEKNILKPVQQQQYFDDFNTRLGRGRGGAGRGQMRRGGRQQGRGGIQRFEE
ncbi:Spy/CpxP family protein refolding chaperone [candidate division KSB1 bacterium]